jgi:arabinose-5-phosphate isomerase
MTRADVALLLSNSGETPELANVIAYTRRFNIPLIGVASRAESTLIQQCDVALILPAADEACPMGLAPTTSTTMTLALGDALAVALMEHRQFSPADYRDFHPGGSLGARLSKVGDLMQTELPSVPQTAPMTDALLVMSERGFGIVAVTNTADELCGVITDGDLRRHMNGLLERTAEEVMTHAPLTVSPDVLAQEAVALMNAKSVTCLIVAHPCDQLNAMGIIRIHDCLRAGVI